MGSIHSWESARIAAPKAPREERGLRLGGSLPILGFPPPSRRGLILKARFNWTTGSCRSTMPALGTTVGRSEASKCAVVGSSGEVFSPFCPCRESSNCCNSSGWSGLLRGHLDFRALLLRWCFWGTFHGFPYVILPRPLGLILWWWGVRTDSLWAGCLSSYPWWDTCSCDLLGVLGQQGGAMVWDGLSQGLSPSSRGLPGACHVGRTSGASVPIPSRLKL